MEDLETPEKIRNLQKKLYVKAKSEPEYRFYSLYDKVYRDDILAHAYELARANKGAPGVDGLTFEALERWKKVGALLEKLKEELKTQTYRPKPVRRVYIPKPDGGQRPLGIPCIRDRIVQAAAKLVLEPIFEADLTDNAYAYRPERGAHGAIKHTHRLLKDGYTEVVDADLSKYFDTIPHRELLRSVARRVSDGKVLKLLKMWLEAPIQDRDEGGKPRLTRGGGMGTPQGGVISPLFANIYMRRFLLAWESWELPKKLKAHVVNYADDFVILCREEAQRALDAAKGIIGRMGLAINEKKTRVVDARRESFDFLGYTFGICYAVGTGKPYLGVRPSRKRIQRFDGNIREFLRENRREPTEDVIQRLSLRLCGWSNYYSYGTLSRAYHLVDKLVLRRVRAWLCRKHNLSGRGTRRFSDEVLYGKYGLVCLTKMLAELRRSKAPRETSPRAGCGKSARPVR